MQYTVTLGHNIKDPHDFRHGGTIKDLLDWMNLEHNEFTIHDLRNATSKEEKRDLKLSLPYIVAGEFNPSVRNTSNFVKSNGLILDLDHVKNLEQVFNMLANDPLIHWMFRSPSGDGIKIGIKFSRYIFDPVEYKKVYKKFAESFEKRYSIQTDNTSDCARACFLSFDESYYYNPEPELWYPIYEKPQQKKYVSKDYSNTEPDLERIAELCRNTSIDNYQDWITAGLALSSLGEQGRDLFKLLSMNKGYEDNERYLDFKFDSFSSQGRVGIGSFFHIVGKYSV